MTEKVNPTVAPAVPVNKVNPTSVLGDVPTKPDVVDVKPSIPTTPWKPAKILSMPKKPGFRQKWVREDLTERFEAEGWKFVEDRKKVLNTPKTIVDGVPLSTAVKKRELLLMELPEAVAKQREAYFKSLTDGALKASVQKFKDTANEGSGKSYGEVVIKGGK